MRQQLKTHEAAQRWFEMGRVEHRYVAGQVATLSVFAASCWAAGSSESSSLSTGFAQPVKAVNTFQTLASIATPRPKKKSCAPILRPCFVVFLLKEALTFV